MRYKNSRLQILHVLKSDSDAYFCSATNVLGSVERKTLLVVVSLLRFTVKPPARVALYSGETLTLNCSATGDPQPIISWRKQGGLLPAGRSQQSNGDLVIRGFQKSDSGYYVCVATSAGVFAIETGTYTVIQRGMLLLKILLSVNCQRVSRAKTRGWRGGSIIEPCESTVLAEKISSDREKCL